MTEVEFDFEHVCATCEHFSKRKRMRVKFIGCALAPHVDGETFGGQNRERFPACVKWRKK